MQFIKTFAPICFESIISTRSFLSSICSKSGKIPFIQMMVFAWDKRKWTKNTHKHCVAQEANCPYQFSFMVNVADDTFSSLKSINSMTYYIVMKCWYAPIFHPPRNLIWLKKWVQLYSMKLCIYACWLAQPSNWQIWSHNIFLGTLHFSA